MDKIFSLVAVYEISVIVPIQLDWKFAIMKKF